MKAIKYFAFGLMAVLGIALVLSQPTSEENLSEWFTVLLATKAAGVAMLLLAGKMGEKWFNWQFNLQD